MLCPACRTELAMAERSGIEIDYCSSCRGVWLDRGELDKIIERSAAPATRKWSGDGHGHGGHHAPAYPKRRKSFLEELFD